MIHGPPIAPGKRATSRMDIAEAAIARGTHHAASNMGATPATTNKATTA
jgi:hypothetical protein